MSAIQTWIGRLSFPVLILLHVSGAIIGAGLFLVLGTIAIVILQVKDDGKLRQSQQPFFWLGQFCPASFCGAREITPYGL
jgi:hypothetical protein